MCDAAGTMLTNINATSFAYEFTPRREFCGEACKRELSRLYVCSLCYSVPMATQRNFLHNQTHGYWSFVFVAGAVRNPHSCTRHCNSYSHMLRNTHVYTCGVSCAKMASSKLFIGALGFTLLHLFQTFSAEASERVFSRTIREADHDHGNGVGEYFVEVGNFLLDEELAAIRISSDFVTNHERNLTSSQVGNMVSTLFSRVQCEARIDNCTKVGINMNEIN